MLVPLLNKDIPEYWPIFEDVLREAIPYTDDMRPLWLKECLYQAMVGGIQLWICLDPKDETGDMYAAFVTKQIMDDITGQACLLVYALKVFKRATRECRIEDMRKLGEIAKSAGMKRLSAYCLHPAIGASLKKAFPNNVEVIQYCIADLSDIEKLFERETGQTFTREGESGEEKE